MDLELIRFEQSTICCRRRRFIEAAMDLHEKLFLCGHFTLFGNIFPISFFSIKAGWFIHLSFLTSLLRNMVAANRYFLDLTITTTAALAP